VQGVGLLGDDDKLDLLADLHTETDLGKGSFPVGRQLGFLCIKPSLPSCKVEGVEVALQAGIVVKGLL